MSDRKRDPLLFTCGVHVPDFILQLPRVSLIEKLLYGMICSHRDDRLPGTAINNAYAAKYFGVEEPAISRALESLSVGGFINTAGLDENGDMMFRLLDHDAMYQMPIQRPEFDIDGD